MTPLIKKLGLKEGSRACILEAPSNYLDLLGPLPGGVVLLDQPDDGLDFIQVFATEQRTLERQVSALKQHLAPAGMLWMCWPKKTSSLETDLTREVVRAIGLHAGLVDVKVCAIDADWSGLKFVFRLKDRKTSESSKS